MSTVAPLASALEAPSPLAVPERSSGLRELDALVRAPDARGFVVVRAAATVLDAVARHVERRARDIARAIVEVDGQLVDDAWRELALRFPHAGSQASPAHLAPDPLTAARALLDRAGGSLIVVREDGTTSFGRALADEVARLLRDGDARCLFLVLTDAAERVSSFPTAARARRVIEVQAESSADDRTVWWEAVARDAAQRGLPGLDRVDRLDALDAWWSAARATPRDARAPSPALGPAAARLLRRLALSRRSWQASQLHRLGSAAAAEELVRAGALSLDASGRLVAGPALALIDHDDEAADTSSHEHDDREVVAAALDAIADPWAAARASELHASQGAFDQAERAAVRAISSVADASARADFWGRWQRTLAALPDDEAMPCLLRSADLALRIGDIDRAHALATAALAKRPDTFATLLTLGRANVARGDLPTASYWLGKSLARAADPTARAQVEVELAEVRNMEGDIDGARRHADAALATIAEGALPPESASTRLHARNVLGKILLATAAWQQAEQHFAVDACEAALSGDVMGELRARLNRSIALLSSGRLDEARAMLGSVLAEGEGRGELRAVAYALTNLATIAILKREYAEALRLSERAFEARRRLGDKVSLALLIGNLAELKLQLGHVAEAEQALSFGRQACGPGMPGARASHFAYTAALIHLERRRTVEAAAELKIALSTARGSGNGSMLAECHRLAARIALEDGDLHAAESALEHAGALADSPRERAWVALLEAARARAAGEPFGDAAVEALDRARAADDPELLREAHLLSHHAAVVAGDPRAARAQLEAAVAVRDQIADALPEDLRRRYLARRDLADLAHTEAAFASASNAPRPSAPPADGGEHTAASAYSEPPRSRVDAAPVTIAPQAALRRMVGRTPAMLALAGAIQRVGPSEATVLVHGESGTGKELVAEAIHEASARRTGPLVKVNCAALVESLLLSELFGHEKGSFTGAAARRRGRFEAAEGGTLFLDEIGDISPRTQVALLRVLQDKTFERVGGVAPLRANVRIVCATHRDLAAMVTRGEFREDLYYRLRGVVLEVPSLRSRVPDLPAVAAAILERLGAEHSGAPKRLSPSALEGLARHPWPGNVRELENALRAAALFAEGDAIELTDFTSNVVSLRGLLETPAAAPATPVALDGDDGTTDACDLAPMTQPSKGVRSIAVANDTGPGEMATDVAYAAVRGGVSLSDLKRDIERECIARALTETSGNITRAAGLLGMKRPRLSQLVKQYGFGGGGGAGAGEIEAEDGE